MGCSPKNQSVPNPAPLPAGEGHRRSPGVAELRPPAQFAIDRERRPVDPSPQHLALLKNRTTLPRVVVSRWYYDVGLCRFVEIVLFRSILFRREVQRKVAKRQQAQRRHQKRKAGFQEEWTEQFQIGDLRFQIDRSQDCERRSPAAGLCCRAGLDESAPSSWALFHTEARPAGRGLQRRRASAGGDAGLCP